jgi:hypothetical protein
MVLSAGVTILLGVKGYAAGSNLQAALSIAAVVASAVLTSLATLEAFVDTGARWVRLHVTLHKLYALERELKFMLASGAELSPTDCDAMFQRLQGALDRSEWSERRTRSLTAPLPSRANP